jgi:hypothetical protein
MRQERLADIAYRSSNGRLRRNEERLALDTVADPLLGRARLCNNATKSRNLQEDHS